VFLLVFNDAGSEKIFTLRTERRNYHETLTYWNLEHNKPYHQNRTL